MATVENRAAENGSIIIEDTNEHVFNKSKPIVAIRILDDTVIATIESEGSRPTINIDYYEGLSLTVDTQPILGNITKIQLASGVVQAIY